MSKKLEIQPQRVDELYNKIATVIDKARQMIVTTVNTAEVYSKFEIGRYIIEDEQDGNYRAQYGKAVLFALSARLTERYGKGWSVDTLEQTRRLYITYSNSATPLRKLDLPAEISETLSDKSLLQNKLKQWINEFNEDNE